MEVLDLGEETDITLSPTEELRVMGDEEELQFWRQTWSQMTYGLDFSTEPGTPGDEFLLRKASFGYSIPMSFRAILLILNIGSGKLGVGSYKRSGLAYNKDQDSKYSKTERFGRM
eukprot:4078641-Amphidinium_carterae.2